MKEPEAEFQDSVSQMETALAAGIKSFAEWTAKNWKMTPEDWTKSFKEPQPKGDYFDGYNAGVESVIGACQCFLDEYDPR